MAYHSKYSGVEVDALLDKIKDDEVGSIDSSLSTTSENPVQNKVITGELNKKANKADIATVNGQPLTNGGNIEVITDAYDDTEIKGKLTELDSQIAAEATARTEADAALQTQINGKQEALTLTVKDNGNIVLANIQGQSKEFMPATPSGDPMHWAYVAAGAEYNDTGADIVRTTPWADMIDDDYTGDYGKTVVHKAGYWYLNGLGDITNNDMQIVYVKSIFCGIIPSSMRRFTGVTNVNFINNLNRHIMNGYNTFFNSLCKTIIINNNNIISRPVESVYSTFTNSTNLLHLIGTFEKYGNTDLINPFVNCKSLITLKFNTLKLNVSFSDSPNLSIKSVLYMINNEAATSPITITLHNTAYNRCMANADILAALEAHTNISLASA